VCFVNFHPIYHLKRNHYLPETPGPALRLSETPSYCTCALKEKNYTQNCVKKNSGPILNKINKNHQKLCDFQKSANEF
jgi:hypothetical protein